jgi:hypothetical protein
MQILNAIWQNQEEGGYDDPVGYAPDLFVLQTLIFRYLILITDLGKSLTINELRLLP